MSIIFVDSLPGIGKSKILEKMYLLNKSVIPYATTYNHLPAFNEVYFGHANERISNAVYTLELMILGHLADLVNQVQYVMNKHSILVMEDSIFWPYVWIEAFADLGYLNSNERTMFIDILRCLCDRFLHYTSIQGYKVIYEFIHISNEKPYEFCPKSQETDQCYQSRGKIFLEHPNFFTILMKYFPAMKEFIGGLSFEMPEKYVHIYDHKNYINLENEFLIRKPEDIAQVFLDDCRDANLTLQEKYYDSFISEPDLLDYAFD